MLVGMGVVWSPDPSIHAYTRTRLTACASGKEGSGQTARGPGILSVSIRTF